MDNHPEGSRALEGALCDTTAGPAKNSQANSRITITQPSTIVFPPAPPSKNLSVLQPTSSSGHIHPDVNVSAGMLGDADQDQPIKYELSRILCCSNSFDQLRREIHHMIINDRIEMKTIHNAILHMSRNPHYTPKERISFRTNSNIGAILRTRDDESVSPPEFRPTDLDVGYYALDLGIRYEYLVNGSRDEHLSFVEIAKMGGTLLHDLGSVLETVTDYQARRNLRAVSHHFNFFVHLILNDRMMLQEDNLISLLQQIDPSLVPPLDLTRPKDDSCSKVTSTNQAGSSYNNPIDMTSDPSDESLAASISSKDKEEPAYNISETVKSSSPSKAAKKTRSRAKKPAKPKTDRDRRRSQMMSYEREAETQLAAVSSLSLSSLTKNKPQEDAPQGPPLAEDGSRHGNQLLTNAENDEKSSPSTRFPRQSVLPDEEVRSSINNSGLASRTAEADILYSKPRWWKYDITAPVDEVNSGISSAPSRPSMTPHDTPGKGIEKEKETGSDYRDRVEEANSNQEGKEVVTRDVSRPSWSARTSYLTPMKRKADAYTDEVLDGVVKKLRVFEQRDE
ncbi:hypothetical protein I302_100558 [Kwoniella bestiolae CBS 10118]|uniref:Uncharacterized protein n=1 Tax=Kwoniella bestiolae CBS 10118 TaxID=1296100 RepID=A0A1B9G5G7_9TREE|nr:hypothetical protein I302_03933 [Kwoniella bestiolae CBS 10118]OCF26253.1 hypothetical protein I302_03933 [Kwoniella bestiolae CBS 10118]